MKIKHSDISIPQDRPFENCKLNREPIAEILTTIVSTLPDGFVMALDNKWGAGKTTFVKMWKEYLKVQQFETLYFNAWENDFQNEVIVALLSVFNELEKKSKEKYDILLSKTAKVMKAALPIALKGVANKLIGEKTISEVIKAFSEFGVEEVESQLETFKTQKNSIVGFKKSLIEYINSSDKKKSGTKKAEESKPVIFFIDELDRCRPNYAVEVLEKIKHLFSVKGIVFVLSIDKTQLGNSIKGYYGSDLIDSDEYLKKFIDLNYSMPEPDKTLFINHLYQYYGFSDYFELQKKLYVSIYDDSKQMHLATQLFYNENHTLRQIEKSMARVRLTLGAFTNQHFVYPYILIFIDYLSTFHSDLFNRIEQISMPIQQFIDEIEGIMLKIKGVSDLNTFDFLVAELIYRYQRSHELFRKAPLKNLIDFDTNRQPKLLVKSQFENSQNNIAQLIHKLDNSGYNEISLRQIMDKYNLTDSIKF